MFAFKLICTILHFLRCMWGAVFTDICFNIYKNFKILTFTADVLDLRLEIHV
jgi:hypothetical protein